MRFQLVRTSYGQTVDLCRLMPVIHYTLFFRLIGLNAAVACPLRALMHCVFRHALLHTTFVMCGYLCYCHVPVSFDQSDPSPLTSLINKVFLPAELQLTGFFVCFSHHSLQTLETVVRENPSSL